MWRVPVGGGRQGQKARGRRWDNVGINQTCGSTLPSLLCSTSPVGTIRRGPCYSLLRGRQGLLARIRSEVRSRGTPHRQRPSRRLLCHLSSFRLLPLSTTWPLALCTLGLGPASPRRVTHRLSRRVILCEDGRAPRMVRCRLRVGPCRRQSRNPSRMSVARWSTVPSSCKDREEGPQSISVIPLSRCIRNPAYNRPRPGAAFLPARTLRSVLDLGPPP